MTDFKCLVCDTEQPGFAWTDRHGIAQCSKCGAPYRLFHYEGEGDARKRVEKPPSCLADDVDVATMRLCWAETRARFSAVGFGLSFSHGSYDVATESEYEQVAKWYEAHK